MVRVPRGYHLALSLTRSRLIAAWFVARIVPMLGGLLLVFDAAVGMLFITTPDGEFSSRIYTMARQALEIDGWGVVILVLSFVTGLAWFVQGRCHLVGFLHTYVLSGYWIFWTVLSTLSAIGPNGTTGLVPLLSALPMALHVLVGLSWPDCDPRHQHALHPDVDRLS